MKHAIVWLSFCAAAAGCSSAPPSTDVAAHRDGVALVASSTATQAAPVQARQGRVRGRHVMAWGSNGYGQIGDGQEEDAALIHPYPYILDSVPAPAQLSAGDNDSLLLTQDGHVWIWGLNNHGQLGDGTTNDRTIPQVMTSIDHVKFVAGGYFHNAVIKDGKDDGTVWAWGENSFGELGQGTTGADIVAPVHVPLPKKATKLATGGEYTMALLEDGTVWAWGVNTAGQLGGATCPTDPMQDCGYILSPVEITEIAALGRVVDMAGIWQHSLFALEDGSVWAMGLNWAGQLGIGPPDPFNASPRHSTPVKVMGLDGVKVKAVAAGVQHSLALDTHGTVYGWGQNGDGQAGDSSPNAPAIVTTAQKITCADNAPCLRGATIIQAGHNSSEALVAGHVWAWGRADVAELGQIVPCCSAKPLEVPGVSGVEMLSTNSEHTLAYGRYRPDEAACDHPSAYRLTDLAPLPGDVAATAMGINNEGLVVGVSFPAQGGEQAVLWTYDGIAVPLGTLSGDAESDADAINDVGDIVGTSALPPAFGAARFSNNTVTALPTLSGTLGGQVYGLNDSGIGVGFAELADGAHAVEYGETTAVDLGTGLLGGSARAEAINNNGEIIGFSFNALSQQVTLFGPSGPRLLGSPAGYPYCAAWSINQGGEAAGVCTTQSGSQQAVIYRGGPAVLLGMMPGDTSSEAQSLNSQGQVVGASFSSEMSRAVLFDGGAVIDLATRVTAIGAWTLTYAIGINDNGEIAGQGQSDGSTCHPNTACRTSHAFLLAPTCDGQ